MSFSTLRINNSPEFVYLDHQATTPLASEVAARVPEWLSAWGNASSIHGAGRGPKKLLREARVNFAKMIAAEPLEVVFTAGGSEANSFALKGRFDYVSRTSDETAPRRHYVVSAVEHPSVLRASENLRARGAKVSRLAIDRSGQVDMNQLDALLGEGDVALVSVMLANNETGHIYPIREIARRARAAGALMHSDCVQALGKMNLNMNELGLDMASFAGHKFYALKGVGALWIRKGLSLEPLINGGGQERRRRGGTENIAAIASLGLMAEHASEVPARAETMRELRDELEARIASEISGVAITGQSAERLPGSSSMTILGIDGETLLMNLDMKGFAVSTGAACSSGSPEPSPTLLAMGLSRAEAQSSLRVGLGWSTTREEIERFVEALKETVARLRSFESFDRDGRRHA